MSGFTPAELKEEQEKDPDLAFILNWLKNDQEPPENELFLASPAAKNYWVNKELYYLDEDGVLFNLPKNEGKDHRLVVPSTLTKLVLELCHELPSAGHQGVSRTRLRVKHRYYWYNMTTEIRQFVASCEVCNHNKKPTRYGRCPLTRYHSSMPMERVHIDFMGPLPKTKRGNEHILMMVDQFTKWTECIPLPSQTAEVTAQAAVNEFFTRFGYPFHIFSDQGRNFESSLFKAICQLLHIHKSRTTPYRPMANGQVERQNRTLMDAVRCFVDSEQDNWDQHLAQLGGAMRSSVNRSTGFTPNKLMLGREVNQPAELMFGSSKEQSYSGTEEYVVGLEKAIKSAHEIARDTLKTSQLNMKRDYDVKAKENELNPGDLVYVLDSAHVKGKSKKLSPPWKGPGIIIGKVTGYVYTVKFQKVVFNTNHDRLKVCKDRKIPKWLLDCQAKFKKGEDVIPPKDKGSGPKKYCVCRGPDIGTAMASEYPSEERGTEPWRWALKTGSPRPGSGGNLLLERKPHRLLGRLGKIPKKRKDQSRGVSRAS